MTPWSRSMCGRILFIVVTISAHLFSIGYNVSQHEHSTTALMITFPDISGIKPFPTLPPYELALRIIVQTETTLINKQNVTQFMRCSILVFLTPLLTMPTMGCC
ncbi:hypothetical protein TNCV_578941 [Trichonephila clavipes]|nr:hypothetical protein TNCV_578941 [Trichonephila clavipes]